MQIISFGTDYKILDENSRAKEKLLSYIDYFDTYYSVVICNEDYHVIKANERLEIIKINKKKIVRDLKKLLQYLKSKKFKSGEAFVSSQDPFEIGLISNFFAKKLDLNLHIQIHTDIFSNYFIFENLRTVIQKIISVFVIRKARSIRVVSQSLRENLIKKYKISEDIIFVAPIIPELKKTEMNRDGKNDDIFKILMVSRLVPVKNIESTITAFGEFSQNKNTTLTILGDGPLKDILEKQIRADNLQEKIILRDWVENVPDYYVNSDLFLHTSKYEGFGTVAYEALFYGLPIVATPFGGALDRVADSENILVTEGFSAQEIGKTLNEAYSRFKNKKINTEKDLQKFDRTESINNQIASWRKTLESNIKKILFITQTIDNKDPVLGFVCGWINEFSNTFEKINVICLKEGDYAFKNNVKVHSLGKEKGNSKIFIYFRYIYLIISLRKDYDTVFAHMNPEYVIGGGIFWKIMQKRVLFWYAHGSVSARLKMALRLSDYVLTSTNTGMRLDVAKKRIIGQAIDLSKIKFEKKNFSGDKINSLIWGRIGEIKNYETSIEAVKILHERNINIYLTIIGSPQSEKDKVYYSKLKEIVQNFKLEQYISFESGKPQNEIFPRLKDYQILISSSMTGSLDKVIPEAMAAGIVPFACNQATEDLFEEYTQNLFYREKDPVDLANRIENFIKLENKNKQKISKKMNEIVVKNHSLETFISRINNVV